MLEVVQWDLSDGDFCACRNGANTSPRSVSSWSSPQRSHPGRKRRRRCRAKSDTTTAAATTAAQPSATIADAQAAIAANHYAQAVSIGARLGREDLVGRRIANQLARRATAAVGSGDQARASSLLRQAGRYPTTYALTQARATYRATKARAAARAAATRAAAEQRRRATAERKAAEEAATDSDGNCDPNYAGACLDPSSPDYDCQGGSGDGPDYTGPVQVVGTDRFGLDRDGDGAACE